MKIKFDSNGIPIETFDLSDSLRNRRSGKVRLQRKNQTGVVIDQSEIERATEQFLAKGGKIKKVIPDSTKK